MFKTKKDVDRHVADIASKIKNENERNLRGYNIAKLYYDVKEYDIAKRYLAGFLSIKETSAPAHKLMGDILEKSGHLERAAQSYKRSLDLNENQKDVILKMCELYCKLPVDPERARYWADRGEKLFPHSEVIFQLRESMVNYDGEQNMQELEDLFENELLVRPHDVKVRIKLLKLYLDTERIKKAYEYALEVEKQRTHFDSPDWYYCLGDVYEAYLEEQEQCYNQALCIHLLEALDRLIVLTLEGGQESDKQNGFGSNAHSRTSTSASTLQAFDQHLLKAWQLKDNDSEEWKAFLNHMQGQLYFHMATIILKRAKEEQGNRKEASRMGAALLLASYSFKPLNPNSAWHLQSSLEARKLHSYWHDFACFRLSQSGHIVMGMCREDRSKWLGKIRDQGSTVQSKDRIYQRVFNSRLQRQGTLPSYFLNADLPAAMSVEFPDQKALLEYDAVAHKLHPGSLHHLVWLALQQYNVKDKAHPIYGFKVFEGLQYSVSKLENPSPESLCLLDVEAFLYATVRCSALALEEHHALSYVSPDTPPFLPTSISEQLCTEEQAKWWRAAFDLFSGAKKQNFGELRRRLQHGIEVIRAIGNHGMDVGLVIHLAETFASKAAELKAQTDNDVGWCSELGHLETRAAMYWKTAITILERLSKNLTVMAPKEYLFPNYSRELAPDDVNKRLEEGRFFLACLAMEHGQHEEAITAFETLHLPMASFYQSLTYKKLAAEEFGNKPRESITSEMRSRHIILLTRARDALHITMDRLRSDRNHHLNEVLPGEIEDIETRLARIDPDTAQRYEFAGSDDSFSQDTDDQDRESPTQNDSPRAMVSLRTPIKESPRRNTDYRTPAKNDLPVAKQGEHLRPSPERLDAQIRSLAFGQDSLVKVILEHNKSLLETNLSILEELKQSRALLETNRSVAEELKQNKTVMEQLTMQLQELTKQIPLIAKGNFRAAPRRMARRSISHHRHAAPGDDDNEEEHDEDYYDGYYYDEEGDYDGGDGVEHDNHNFHSNPAYVYPDQQLHGEYPYGQTAGLHGASPFTYAPPPLGPPYFPPGPGIPVPPVGALQGGSIVQGHPIPAVGSPYFQPGAATMFTGLPFSEGQKLPEFNFDVAASHLNGNIAMDKTTRVQNFPPFLTHQPSVVQPHVTVTPVDRNSADGRSVLPMVAPPATVVTSAPAKITDNTLKLASGQPSNSASPVQPSPLASSLLSSAAPFILPEVEPPTAFNVAPHAFQIALPPQAVIVSSPSSVLTSNGLKQANTSVLASSQNQPAENNASFHSPRRTRKDTDDTSSSYHEEDLSGPDFTPVIPLPAEVEVKTGEEDEKILFEERAKLFRYVDKEWKERGVGTVKILKNEETNRLRILMRRDQILKTCANHYILPDMTLNPMKNMSTAWLWAAQDYADEEIRMEQFCIRFKTPEIGHKFKQTFDIAKEIAARGTPNALNKSNNAAGADSKQTGFGDKFRPITGSWECSMCLVNNDATKALCVACSMPRLKETAAKSSHSVSTSNDNKTGFGDKFRPKAGSWACPACLLNNDAGKTSCSACATVCPGAVVISQSTVTPNASPAFKFGTSATTSSSTSSSAAFAVPAVFTPPTSSFKFGFSSVTSASGSAPSATFANSPQMPTFNFSVASSVSSTTTTPASQTSLGVAIQKDGFVFGNACTSPQPKPSGYIFGASPVKSEESAETVTTTPEALGPASTLLSTLANKQKEEAKFELGGFSFTKTPVIKPVDNDNDSSTKPKDTSIAKQESAKPNPFVGLTFSAKPGAFSLAQFQKPDNDLENATVECSASAGSLGSILGGSSTPVDLSFTALAQEHAKPDAFKKDPNFEGFSGKGETVFGKEVKDTDTTDEFEPNVEFKPVISLPELVVIKTGEEDEEKLFGERSKLFRFITETKEWKERGVGELKIMRHKQTGRVRILMRREQVLKLCANHYITKDIKLQPMSTSDKSWIWVVHDFSEGEIRIERLAAKFKTCELAMMFKEVFEEQQRNLPEEKTEDPSKSATSSSNCGVSQTQPPLAGLFKHEGGSWECDACLIRNKAQDYKCMACGSPVPGAPVNEPLNLSLNELFKPKEGSWKCAACYVRNEASLSKCAACQLSKEGTESEPVPVTNTKVHFKFGLPSAEQSDKEASVKMSGFTFAATQQPFKFGDSDNNPATSTPTASPKEFRFGTPQNFTFNFGGIRPKSPSKTPKSPVYESAEGEQDEDTCNESEGDSIYFHPVVPLPDKIEVRTGEEDEEVRYCHRAKLYRWSDGEWKERGLGDFKILFHQPSRKLRLLMRREQILKICCNHYLSVDMKFLPKDDRSWMWYANDFSENEVRQERLAIRFKTLEIARKFKQAIDEGQEQLKSGNFTPSSVKVHGRSEPSPTKTFSFRSDDQQTSPGAFSFGSRFTSFGNIKPSDVEIVLQKKATEAQEKKALQLKLPANFYLYENATPCPGCRGCHDDDIDDSISDIDADVIFVWESTLPQEKVEKALALKLPPNFYSYEDKPPCPGCRGCTDSLQPSSEKLVEESSDAAKESLPAADLSKPIQEDNDVSSKPDTENETPLSNNNSGKDYVIGSSSLSNISFAALSKNPSTMFHSKPPDKNFTFAGAGTQIFGQSNNASQNSTHDSDEEEDANESNAPSDPHFEPVVPMPELIQLSTGEEDEDKVFGHRCKLYRYDLATKQWKERGLGEIKLLKHRQTGKFRVLMRREQIFKIACNHALTPSMELKPLQTHDATWCWYANDFAEEKEVLENFAARFKTPEIAQMFFHAFQNCQKELTESNVSSSEDH